MTADVLVSLSTSHSQQFILELMSALRVCVEKMQPGTDSIKKKPSMAGNSHYADIRIDL